MLVELSTGKTFELSEEEYSELVEQVCKKQCEPDFIQYPSDSGGLYAGDAVLKYCSKYGCKKHFVSY